MTTSHFLLAYTTECVCLKCSYLISNLARLHHDRRSWHRALLRRPGGKPCVCHIHPDPRKLEGAAERAAACQNWEEAERAAVEAGGDGAAERWEAASAESEVAQRELAAAAAKEKRARKYDEMTSSVEKLMEVLMPCGKVAHPELSIIGAGEFQTYKRRCISGDCANRIWRSSEACGFDSIFGAPCPTEANEECTEWRGWEKRLRGVNEEGKEFHSMEWLPKHGSKKERWAELLSALKETPLHMWRDDVMQQSVRVYEDRKSGRHLHELIKRRRLLTTPQLVSDVLDVIVTVAEAALEPPAVLQPGLLSRRLCTLRALQRLADLSEKPPVAAVKQAEQAEATAQQVFDALAVTATIQSDYASQAETSREFHATCATKERHNYLVTLIGYRSRQERRARPRKAQPRRYVSGQYSTARQPSSRYATRDERETIDFKQTVDALFAFHKAGFKPNARSYNIVMEDVCHFLKYGTILHGEWFIDGQRVPLAHGSHRQPLPPGMAERPIGEPDFEELARMEARTDGCPNQFDYGTNYHQTAEWCVKTAQWALADAKAKRAQAEAALAAATAALEAASAEAQPAAAAEMETRRAEASEVLAATAKVRHTIPALKPFTTSHL